jgi:hypothetical protein
MLPAAILDRDVIPRLVRAPEGRDRGWQVEKPGVFHQLLERAAVVFGQRAGLDGDWWHHTRQEYQPFTVLKSYAHMLLPRPVSQP